MTIQVIGPDIVGGTGGGGGGGAVVPKTLSGTANRVTVTGGTNAVLETASVNVNTSLLPSPGAGDAGKALVASGANAAGWSAVTPVAADITGTANRLGVAGGTGASLQAVTLNVDATQFPNSTSANDGLPLVASSAANTATWKLPQAITDLATTGLVSWGGAAPFYSMTGTTFSILKSGIGRINGAKVTWAGGETVALTAGKSYFIGYTATNTLAATDASTVYSSNPFTYENNLFTLYSTTVVLYQVWFNGLEVLIAKEDHPYRYPTAVSIANHFRLGAVYTGTGGVIRLLSSANRTIDSLGVDSISDHGLYTEVPDSASSALSTVCVFRNAGGTAQRFARRKFNLTGTPATPPTAGATYTNNGSTFTVLYYNTGAPNTLETWMSIPVGQPEAAGNLSKASGTGDNTIAYTAVATNRIIPTQYINSGVVTNLGTGGATRYSIVAIYALKDDKNSALIQYIGVPSNTAYSGTAAAANSIGTGASPDMSQFVMPTEISLLEPVLTGFVLNDGNARIIPNVSTNGFTAGVRSFKATSNQAAAAGNVTVANAVNVSLSTTNFDGILSATEVNTQLAMDKIDDCLKGTIYPRRNTFALPGARVVQTDCTNWLIMGRGGTLIKSWAVAKTGPTGADMIFDILKSTNNGSSFATIWSTTGNRVKIAASAVAGNSSTFDVTTFNAGDIFRVDVAQVGSTIAGSDVTVVLDTLTTNT